MRICWKWIAIEKGWELQCGMVLAKSRWVGGFAGVEWEERARTSCGCQTGKEAGCEQYVYNSAELIYIATASTQLKTFKFHNVQSTREAQTQSSTILHPLCIFLLLFSRLYTPALK